MQLAHKHSGTRSLIWTLIYVNDDHIRQMHEQLTFIRLKQAIYTCVQLRDSVESDFGV